MKIQDIQKKAGTIKGSDAFEKLLHNADLLNDMFSVGEDVDQKIDGISDGLHVLGFNGTKTDVAKAYGKMVHALYAAQEAIEIFKDKSEEFYANIPD